ncbi:MAG: 50S ribosomal protein L4 [Candidatus Acidiferrales bacterium]
MAVVDVKNLDGKKVGQVELADAVWGVEIKPHLLHEASRWYLAGVRRGTHKTKVRHEVAGSGKKLWKQKGTGRARMGSVRSPIWRKGGTVHGPQPRDYSYRLPRKVLLGALRSGLSAKLAEEKLIVIDAWQLETHKTKALREALSRLDGANTMLLVDVTAQRNMELASRNLDGVKLVASRQLQPYDLMKYDRLVVSKDAAVRLNQSLAPKTEPTGLVEIQGAGAVAKPAAKKAAKPKATKSKPARAPRKKKKG